MMIVGDYFTPRSGGEVDPLTGNAFLFSTREESRTVNTPLVTRRSDGREEQIGFTSTTTKVITNEQHWLTAVDADDMDVKPIVPQFSVSNALASKPYSSSWVADLKDPVVDRSEFLQTFPTLSSSGLIQMTPPPPQPPPKPRKSTGSIDLSQKITFGKPKAPTFALPDKISLSTKPETLTVERELAREFQHYIHLRL